MMIHFFNGHNCLSFRIVLEIEPEDELVEGEKEGNSFVLRSSGSQLAESLLTVALE